MAKKNAKQRITVPSAAKDSNRRLRQASRFARVLRVLQLVQHGGYDAQRLAGEIECSERTVYRDLAVLELAGIPWTFDADAKSYRLRPDYRLPVLNLNEDDLVGLATAANLAKASGLRINDGANPTTEKLSASNRNAKETLRLAGQLIEVLNLQLADANRHRMTLLTIQQALIQGKQLRGTYRSPYEPKPHRLRLHPYRLCLVKSSWYVIARPSDGEEPQTFRPTRFRTIELVDEAATVPTDFDLQAYFGDAWAVYRGERRYRVELDFAPRVADVVTETVWHRTQSVTRGRDGTATLMFDVDGLEEIVRWIVGWAGDVVVKSPSELKEAVVARHQAAVEANSPRT
ncbi:MAG TPA: WYL domain-containing transcriptional regulator [Pirellulaceae bacterium]|nr:WYL domain-containing transcriptional regulator [Pirellulaceae bacterium]